jgi:hypothetical protein
MTGSFTAEPVDTKATAEARATAEAFHGWGGEKEESYGGVLPVRE